MKGGFDLYGTYYPDINDAINAEMSQCNEIDNRNNRNGIRSMEGKIAALFREIEMLKERVRILESKSKTP